MPGDLYEKIATRRQFTLRARHPQLSCKIAGLLQDRDEAMKWGDQEKSGGPTVYNTTMITH